MDQYVTVITGPLQPRSMAFAEALSRLLSRDRTVRIIDCETENVCGDTAEFLSSAEEHYLIFVGRDLLENETLRELSQFRLYVEASDIDVAAEMIRVFQETGEIIEGDTARDLRGSQEKLSEAIGTIVGKKLEEDEPKRSTYISYATTTAAADELPVEAAAQLAAFIRRTDPAYAQHAVSDRERRKRIDEMIRQYESGSGRFNKAKIKRRLWLAFIKATLIFKRFLDIIVSLAALILLLPLFTAVALIIKLTDGGPVFYVQTRIGKYGEPFPFPKFRSMVMNADSMKDELLKQAERVGDVTFKMKRDPRVTRIGRFIRRFSIDELPQLWCVLKGDMSLVGPRPPVPREVALYTQEDRRRLEVTPGLTGIWQVSGRADIEFKQQVELDVLYIESHGFWLDILLLLKTIPAVFLGRGAY
jgi:lipopolysaccharide/colanic/teichoic acid biosynthesis glycosyltransferase